ncbi:MAG: hypothetical protein JO015_01595 [Verrucomicrobia bacterium]|nr:hypothetical protein [Verrucomicrobiota bacterium]
MIAKGGFTYRRFEVLEVVSAGQSQSSGDFILGVPEGRYPEFDQATPRDWQSWQTMLREILTTDDQKRLGDELGRGLTAATQFGLLPVSDHAELIEMQPTFEGDGRKRFWVRRY